MLDTQDVMGLCIGGGVMLLMLVLSVILLCGKGAFLIAGYNTMGKEEQTRWNPKALCRAAGVMLLVIALSCSTAMLLFVFGQEALSAPFIIVPIVLVIPFVVWVNTSKRFRA